MRYAAKKLALTLATGYILMFFSELLFWARFDPDGKGFGDLVLTWLAYSALAFVVLSMIEVFRVHTPWAVFLVGALYGWLDEGVLVPTMYADFPINLSWTGLAWHALITVLFGWSILRRSLVEGGTARTLLLAASAGFVYGFWAIFWWIETGTVTPVLSFAAFSLLATVALVAAYWIYDAVQPFAFRVSRAELAVVAIAVVGYFASVTAPAQPLALIILPPLLGILAVALVRNRRVERRETALARALARRARPRAYAALLALPATAIIWYSVAVALDLRIPSNWIVFVPATLAGAVMFVLSLRKVATAT